MKVLPIIKIIHRPIVYLASKSERDVLAKLLCCKENDNSAIKIFLQNDATKRSENFQLVYAAVNIFKDSKSLPLCYSNFLAELGKNTAVAGILQCKNQNSLKTLRSFCLRQINIRDGNHQSEIQLLMSELPVFWNLLLKILLYENSSFLPRTVSNIVLKLLTIRHNTYTKSTPRYKEDYISYSGPEPDLTYFLIF